MRKHSVLVTGGAGFLGSHVADCLAREGSEVVSFDDLSGGFRDNVSAGIRFVRGSITDHRLIDRLFAQYRFEYVFHLAAYAAEGLSHFIKRFNYTNNLIGSVNLINASIRSGVRCLVYTSSIAAYGRLPSPMKETDIPQPEDSYGIAKYAVELELKASRALFGLNSVIFRPHNVYGERQNIGDRYRNVIGIFMNQAMTGQPMTLFGDGKQQRAFSYVGDIAPLIARSIHLPKAYNRIFNIGADQPYSVNQLARVVSTAMGVKPRLKHLPARHEVKIAYASHAALKRVFGSPRQTPLEEGIARMAAWARNAGPRKTSRFKNIELTRGLPKIWLE